MPKYIFLDTNNWIYLSNGFNILSKKHDELHFKLFDFVCKHTANGNLIFLVNDIVIEEWDRNKEHTESQIKQLNNKLTNYLNILDNLKSTIGDEDGSIDELKQKATTEIESRIDKHKQHINEVEDFLKNKTERVEVSLDIKGEAADMAVKKKAPFIGEKKNSMADALILLSSIDHIKKSLGTPLFPLDSDDEEEAIYPESYFVSSNKGDFSDPNNSEKIHCDLEPVLKTTGTSYYYTFAQLVRLIEAEFFSREEEERLAQEHDEHYTSCDFCDQPYESVYISDPFFVPDENKIKTDDTQLELSYKGTDGVKKPKQQQKDFESEIREARCNYCSAENIVCECGEFTFIEEYNKAFECKGECGNFFIANADIDRKGLVHSIDYEILKSPIVCQKCGRGNVPMFRDTDLCEGCENFYSYEN